MPFDAELKRVLDTLTDRVRDEVSRQLAAAASDLTASVAAERAEAEAAARAAADEDAANRVKQAETAAEQRGRDEGRKEGRQEGLDEGRQKGIEEGRREGLEEGRREGLNQGRREGLEEGRRDGLVEGRQEGLEEGRREGREEGRLEERDAAQTALKNVDLATSQRLVDAIRAIDRARSLSEVLDTLVSCAGRETARAAILLVRGDRLRAWRFIGFGPERDEGREFDLPLAESGIIADAARTLTTVSADSTGPLPRFAELPPGRESLAVPVPMGGQAVAILYGDEGPPTSSVRFAWPATLEVMARHAARCLEAITAFRAAHVLSDVASPATSQAAPVAAGSPGNAEDDQAARRYARILVSEIKLYHEAEVMAGRRDRDLAIRLGGEIARARVLYEQRVPAHVRRGADHFHAELVRTLAGGDGSLLEVKS